MCVRKNALQILIPKFGLEGTIYVSGGTKDKQMAVKFEYNEEVNNFSQFTNIEYGNILNEILFAYFFLLGTYTTMQGICISCF